MFEEIKDSIRDILRPIAKKITEINPNTLTLFGLLLSLISAYFFAIRLTLAAGIFLLAGGFFDALDGLVARENNRTTKFGGYLDSICDRFADVSVIIGAMYAGMTQFYFIPFWLMGSLAIFGSLMVSYARARAEAAGASASVGIGDRPVRILLFILGAFFDKVNWAVFIVTVISFITVFQRIVFVRKILK